MSDSRIVSVETDIAGKTRYRIMSSDGDTFFLKLKAEPTTAEIDSYIANFIESKKPQPKSQRDIEDEIDAVVKRVTELSFEFPAQMATRLKASADKKTTEDLYSADGGQVQIISDDKRWK